MASDVPQPGRAEQGIAYRVHQHIAVRVRLQALVVVYPHTTYGDVTALAKSMGIKSVAYTHAFTGCSQMGTG
jgi:ribonuclease BN (tRNA processing enzyme)